MNDSIRNNESIISKQRLKNLYSYSKQSLAPAVSTVGFFCGLMNRGKKLKKRIYRHLYSSGTLEYSGNVKLSPSEYLFRRFDLFVLNHFECLDRKLYLPFLIND